MGLSHIRHWVFDLDNTIYHPSYRLFDQIDRQITVYVAKHLALEPVAARKKQKEYFHHYGTTLRGLMVEHEVNPYDFLHHAHDIDYSNIGPDPALNLALGGLEGGKYIFTSGTKTHAENVLAKLGIAHHFESIFDIIEAQFIPKPQAETYEGFIAQTKILPQQAIMFEDIARNLQVPKNLGMKTVLLTAPENEDANFLNAREDHAFIDYITEDLTDFLNTLHAQHMTR